MFANAKYSYELGDYFGKQALSVGNYADYVRGVKNSLTQIADCARHDYDAAVKAKNAAQAQAVIAQYRAEAAEVVTDGLAAITSTPLPGVSPSPPARVGNSATAKPSKNGPGDSSAHALDDTREKKNHSPSNADNPRSKSEGPESSSEKHDGQSKDPAANEAKDAHDNGRNKNDAPNQDKANALENPSLDNARTKVDAPPTQGGPQGASPLNGFPMNGMPQASGGGASGGGSPGMGNAAGMGSLSGMTHGSALQSGLGGAKPPSTPSFGSGGSTPTSPASSAASPSSFGDGLRSATSGFNSGLASGMGSTGAAPSQQAAQPYQGQQAGLSAGAQAAASQPASAAAPPAQPAPTPGPTGGGMGGGGFMPPVGAGAGGSGGGGPLAPYSSPHGTPAPSGGTTPASTTPASSPASSTQSSAATVPAAGSPILGAGHTTTTHTPRPVNQDLLLAEQIVTELVRADPSSPIEWAVSVLRTQIGTQIFVASNVAGGIYLPRTVFLPTTVKLAALDPALPIGWYSKWIGWPNPMEILGDHYHRTLATIRGVRCSAMATSRPLSRPIDAGIPWAFINRLELPPGGPAHLDAAHQHRLTATDASLAARIASMDPNHHTPLAVEITQQVLGRNGLPGAAVSDTRDAEILDKVGKGSVTEEEWQTYLEEAYQADLEPALHAPLSTDDSDITMREKANYKAFYQAARVKELVSCWAQLPPSIFDVAYAALCAGLNVNATVETFTDAQHRQPVSAAAQ
ncbi:hypothetical protein [Mycobacteroides abscessus]|uniref:hypothetical protein n=1 Tax=Mycobacteroides abscessus TaxID=36809 RepID=UPI0010551EF7|nr:hypothetical protein [Mycobacteroides abscessus]